MAELRAPEQNRLLGQLANMLRTTEGDIAAPEFLPRGLDVMGLMRQLMLPSAETVEKLSYGDPLFRMPTQSNIPITADREYLADVVGMAPMVPAASRATTRLSNEAADQLVRAITRNPEATAPEVLEAAGQMLPLSRMISPEIAARFLPETKVVDEAGKPLVVYHGTPDAFESSIRGESYFSPDPEIAGIYTSPTASSIATSAKRGDAPAVYPSYLEIKKPFDTRDPKIRKEFMEEYYGKYGNRTPLSDSGLPDWTEARDLREWIEETGKNYDGLILDEGGLPMLDGTVKSRGISYVPFDSGQIKSAVSDPQMAGLLDQPAQSVVENPLYKLTKEEFLGKPKIVTPKGSKDLEPRVLTTNENVDPEPFMGGKYSVKMSEDGAAVFDGDKVVASYNFGDTLVVNPKYRKRGIAEELVYQWRSRYPDVAKAKTRTKVSQNVQEKVWERIQNEKFRAENGF